MRIDKRLHLVVPILDDEGKKVVAHVHSTPLSRETVDQHFMILAQTFGALFSRGLGITAGPSVAMRLLKQTAIENRAWEGEAGIERAVVEEIRRLSVVIVPAERGWQQVPLSVAVQQGFISEDDQGEVENAIAFFTVVSAVLNRAQRREMLDAAAALWAAQITSLNSTAFMSSLPTSTGTGHTGAKSPVPATAVAAAANATLDGKPASVPH